MNDDILAVLVIVELRRPEQLIPTDCRFVLGFAPGRGPL